VSLAGELMAIKEVLLSADGATSKEAVEQLEREVHAAALFWAPPNSRVLAGGHDLNGMARSTRERA
jgi:hypothetical protein